MAEHHERSRPQRIRVGGLQDVQIDRVLAIDAACAAQYYAIGFDAAEVPARTGVDLVKLARAHSVRVAEADNEPAGLLAWRDEAPGVAYLADLQVDPELRRFGIGSKLLESMFEEARDLGLREVVVRCWERATWATAFYARHGFVRITTSAPERVGGWADDERTRPLTRQGEIALWAPIPGAADSEDGDRASDP